MKPEKLEKGLMKKLDLVTMTVPLIGIVVLCALFMILPEQSTNVLGKIRGFLGDDLGIYYVLIAAGALICSMYMAFSRYGKIKLGNVEKPEYSDYKWGAMIFTSTMAADILFYSLCEWALYANEPQIEAMGGIQKWASTYPLFHWGPTAWSFYIVLAVAFGFMLHVRGREKQKFSEACRPLLGNRVDGWLGKAIDLIAVLALLAGTATTFSMATPLLSAALGEVFHIPAGVTLDDHDPAVDRSRVYVDGMVWNERGCASGNRMYLSFLCTACLFSCGRRRDAVYSGNRSVLDRKSGTEFYRHEYMDGSAP